MVQTEVMPQLMHGHLGQPLVELPALDAPHPEGGNHADITIDVTEAQHPPFPDIPLSRSNVALGDNEGVFVRSIFGQDAVGIVACPAGREDVLLERHRLPEYASETVIGLDGLRDRLQVFLFHLAER